MRILLAHNSLYFPSHGGGDKSNRLLMEALAARGHMVRVVARMEQFGEQAHQQLAHDLGARDVQFEEQSGLIRFDRNGVDVRTLTRSAHLRAYFARQMEKFQPQIILTSTDDPAQLLFSLACAQKDARVVYLIRATIATPFGPDSAAPNAARTTALRQADGTVGVSEYVAAYARKWGGLNAVHMPISLMDPGEPDLSGRFDNAYVTMVNPCAVKGIGIFLQLASAMPELPFAAVPTWGTTAQELQQLRQLPNVTLLPPVDDIGEILRQTRVMLVPSVWAEARSRIVMEAMLRGIPVIASDVGGLKEAKLGVPYLLPVNPVRHYFPTVDAAMVPVPKIPEQDVAPWRKTLTRLVTDEAHWHQISERSRSAALAYGRTLTAEPFEAYLQALLQKPKRTPLIGLSEEKKRLLALRMKQRARPQWFPRCSGTSSSRLFCFPHAGAGTLAYRHFKISGYDTCPALLPGREDRAKEPPFEDIAQLVKALAEAIQPHLTPNSVFFGHSMGAGVALELIRQLRHGGSVLPAALIVSGARAPQYRLTRPSQRNLSDQELVNAVQSLGGLPDELLPFTLPTLRADLRLYLAYEYQPAEPLPIPLFAYCGDRDPNIAPDQLEEWHQHTTGLFGARAFPGGHFYWQEDAGPVLQAIAEDLSRV